MRESDDPKDIPLLVPDREDVDNYISNKQAQSRDIVRPGNYAQAVKVSTWPMRIMVSLLVLAAAGGSYGAYYFYGLYQDNLRQTNLRISDLELRLNLVDESAAESDNTLMENIQQTIEQYDLLWANWRANNRTFEDIQGEIARLKLANEGQDEVTSNNSQQLATTNQRLQTTQTGLNALEQELNQLGQSVTSLNGQFEALGDMRDDLNSIRQALNSGDDTILGLAGRLEILEDRMESVDSNRMLVSQSLVNLREDIATLQRATGN